MKGLWNTMSLIDKLVLAGFFGWLLFCLLTLR